MSSLRFGRRLRNFSSLVALLSLGSVTAAQAAPGPGLGNIDCGDDEYFKPFTFLENPTGPKGTNVSVMIRGYFMTIFAPDSGHPPGEMGIYDVSNPKAPVEVRHVEGGDANSFREAHSLPVALIDGKQYIAIQTIQGLQFWDFTDPVAPTRVSSLSLPGVNGGDYENVSWQTSWQGRYLYVAGGNQGIYIVDAGNPAEPELLKQVPTSQTGGFRVGPIFALGDQLVISNMDQGGAYAILDISVPDSPALLSQLGQLARIYAIAIGGNDRIYAAGRDGNFLTHHFTDPTKIESVKNALIGQDQLYAAAQDHFVFLGRQNNVVKVDVTDEQNPVVVGEGTLGRPNPDHGQVTPMGNLIFIGNDHGTGSAFFCHQRGRDTTPLTAQTVYPRSGSTGVSPATRVSIVFSDYVDTETVEANVQLRTAAGEPVDAILTYAFNTLSIEAKDPLAEDTTYEVFLGGGLADVTGNALPEETVYRFSTGDTIVIPEPPAPEPGSGGGSGFMPPGTGTGGDATTPPGTGTGGEAPVGEPPVAAGGGGCAVGGSTSATGGPLAAALFALFFWARRRLNRAA